MKRLRDGTAPYAESAEVRANGTKEFIKGLNFSVPLSSLRNVTRKQCPKCERRRQFYCYDCLAVANPETHPAPVSLPIKVHVIFHPGELKSKATSLAAAVISPDVHVVMYPDIPSDLTPEDTLILYPSAQSVNIDEIPTEEFRNYKNVVFVDATWQQSKGIARDERIKSFKQVRIRAQTSLFWRFQENDPSYLATVEAIYYFLREFIVRKRELEATDAAAAAADSAAAAPTTATDAEQEDKVRKYYKGEVDDIILYYIHQYILVQESYQKGGAAATEAATTAAAEVDAAAASASPAAEAEASADGGAKQTPVNNPSNEGRQFTKRHFEGYLLGNVDWKDVLAFHDQRLGVVAASASAPAPVTE